MKKRLIFLITLLAGGLLSANAQQRADQQHLTDPNSFTMILMGDPQGYTKYDINQPIFELTTLWTADNVQNLNIKAVLLTGDLVEQNENLALNRNMLNQSSRQMWESVSRSLSRLDNVVPYIVSAGNHEYGYRSSENGNTHFPEYITFERNSTLKEVLVSTFPNRSGVESLENSAYVFKDKNWGNLLVITSEFAPRDEVLEWAHKLCVSDKYKDYRVIFMTHSFLEENTNERTDNESYKITPHNWGAQVWEKLIKTTPNIRLVICGHTGHPGKFEDSVAYRSDKNDAGKDVHQMMFNVQILGGGWEGNGGDGWLRILEFMPDGKTIKVKTYSPFFGISPTTKQFAHRTGKCDQFDMVIDK